MRDAERVNASNARACLEAASAFVDSDVGGDERSVAALQLLSDANAALCAWASSSTTKDEDKAEIIAGAWGDVVRELGRISYEDARAAVRDDAVLTLQRVLLGARELDAGGDLWLTTFDSVLFATLRELTETVRKMKGRDGGAAENTARIAVSCVTKTFLQYASKMRDEDEDAFRRLLAVIDAASSLQNTPRRTNSSTPCPKRSKTSSWSSLRATSSRESPSCGVKWGARDRRRRRLDAGKPRARRRLLLPRRTRRRCRA